MPADRFAEVREALADLEFVVIGDGKPWPMTKATLVDPPPDVGAGT